MKKYHFIGVCGKGTGNLAVMLKSKGNIVTGSDEGFYEPMLGYLKSNDIPFYVGYKAENIPQDVDYIVIGKHAKLTPETNIEVAEAFKTKEKIISLPVAVNQLIEERETIICAGSFGKSTITSLASFVLDYSGKDPSYFIGAIPIDLETSGIIRNSKIFVLEGDEYPSANFDNSPKFLHYKPQNIILTSCEHDHLNVYPTLESYLKTYIDLVKITPSGGIFVYAKNGAHIEEKILPYASNLKCYSYALENADYTAENISYGQTTTFDLIKNGNKLITLETKLLGQHNIENILGVSAMLLEKKLVSLQELQNGIKNFHGVKGRLDKKKSNSQIPIYESYGSSYSKTKADISAIKLHFPEKNIINIFEPNTFSWRIKENLNWYTDVFDGCDFVYIFNPENHGKKNENELSTQEMVDHINKGNNTKAIWVKDKVYIYNNLKQNINKDSLILMTTSGALDNLPEELPQQDIDKWL